MENKHKLILIDRKSLCIEGVSELISFDENAIELNTLDGRLFISGKELTVGTLCVEKGSIDISGRIEALEYLADTPTKGGIFKRFFG